MTMGRNEKEADSFLTDDLLILENEYNDWASKSSDLTPTGKGEWVQFVFPARLGRFILIWE